VGASMADRTLVADHYFSSKPKSRPRYGLIRTCLRGKGFEFLTASGVFSRQRVDLGSRLLVESMILPQAGCLLDVGCGYGTVGIVAAATNPCLQVFMVDVNLRAVRLARLNIMRNFVANAEVKRGFLYEPVKNIVFDCILSNPPISAGLETVKEIIIEAPNHLHLGGVFEIVVRSKVGGKRLKNLFFEAFGNVEVLARQSGYRVLSSRKK
jgi:16S rRNA (guanine1207-N2)-methyltransferase